VNITDELLMAYADDELDEQTRAEVADELAKQPALARKVEQHRALRAQVKAAFDPMLTEPIPERLKLSTEKTSPSSLTDIAQARATKAEMRKLRPMNWRSANWTSANWTLANWTSVAASIAIGILIGFAAFNRDRDAVIAQGNGLTATGELARALTEDFASRPNQKSPVRIGVSYQAKSGDVCRTFAMTDKRQLAGLACHATDASRDSWRIRMVVPIDSVSGADYRMAASAIPSAVLDQVNREIQGEPFDADQEAQLAARGWSSR
jgi:hypothetical protein